MTCFGQIVSSEEIQKMPIREISNTIPDSNYRTINSDTIVEGEIGQICLFRSNNSGHGAPSQIGSFTIHDSVNQNEVQVIFIDNSKVENLKNGEVVSLELTKYDPKDSDFSGISHLSCNIIKRSVLICKLK